MSKRNVTLLTIIIGVYFACYLTATIFQSDFWGNILAPIGSILSFGILFRSFLHTNKADFRRYIWLSFCLAVLSWFVADTLWAIDALLLNRNPDSNQYILLFYFLNSAFLFAGLMVFSIKSIRKWNILQLAIDSVGISVSVILLLWVLLLDKDLQNLGLFYKDGWYSTVSLVLDLVLFAGILAWSISLRRSKIHYIFWIIIGFVLLYSITDIVYYYLYFKDLYIPNSIVDAAYMASLLGIAIGVSMVPASYYINDKNANEGVYSGYNRNTLLILPVPVMLLLYEGFNLPDLFVCGLIISSHSTVTYFIQSAMLKEQLLKREKMINLDLERKIEERTRELLDKNAQLDFLSNQDTVTNLYNRRFFMQELEKKVAALDRDNTLTLAFIDLDRFKTINDAYGHYIGDHILIELARRLMTYGNPNTLIARLGGDEFVIAFDGKCTRSEAEEILRKVVLTCSEPIKAGEYSFDVTISIGVSMYPGDADSTDMLMRNADMAMYQAKKEGNNKIVVFNDILKKNNRQKNKIEIGLRKANFNKEFTLYYQPQFTIPDKKLIGMEALLRWNCPGLGNVSPVEFIPIAEEINWIVPIGEWVMLQAVSQIAQWNREYDVSLKMAINVSPKQLAQADFSHQILSALALEGIPAEWIDVEITEGVALEGGLKINKITEQFQDTGITVSIDDFGTGYSSLSYLKMFPFKRVKIALQLIDNITFDRYDLQIVRSILLLAESIGVECIAEGVETQEQFDLLHGLGCRQMQGYFLGKPMPAGEFEARFLTSNKEGEY